MISKLFLVLASSCLLGALAAPQYLAAPQFLAGITPVAPANIISSYHSQDELGQYTYGYSGGPSAKQETKTADGITQGSYSYVDAYGLPQTVSYVSDPVNGFRAAGTNFPVPVPSYVAHPGSPVAVPIAEAVAPADTVEVAAAKAHHFAEKAAAVARLSRKRRSAVYAAAPLPVAHAYAAPFAYPAPVAHAYAAPLAYAAPVAPVAHAYAAPVAPVAHAYAAPLAYAAPAVVPVAGPSASQYHSQDELGQYRYGYANQDSAKEEVKTADGITRGSYSYRDAYGLPQTVSYIADPLNGFRAAGTNLPVAPVA